MSDDLFSGNAARKPAAPKPATSARKPAGEFVPGADYTAADIEVLLWTGRAEFKILHMGRSEFKFEII